MIGQITNWILDAIRAHGGRSVFVGVLIEQVIVPIPSPAIIMGAGVILIPSDASVLAAFLKMSWEIVLPGVVASTLGALLCYFVGMWSGKVFVDKFHIYLGFTWQDVEWMGKKMSVSGAAATLFFMRAIPIVPLSLVSLVGGVLEIRLRTFLWWSFLGSIPRCYLLGYLGWQLGASALSWAKGVNRFESLISLAIVGLAAAGMLHLRRRIRSQIASQK